MARFLTHTTDISAAETSACVTVLVKTATMSNGHKDALDARCTR